MTQLYEVNKDPFILIAHCAFRIPPFHMYIYPPMKTQLFNHIFRE